jgi:hypothetical protein
MSHRYPSINTASVLQSEVANSCAANAAAASVT